LAYSQAKKGKGNLESSKNLRNTTCQELNFSTMGIIIDKH